MSLPVTIVKMGVNSNILLKIAIAGDNVHSKTARANATLPEFRIGQIDHLEKGGDVSRTGQSVVVVGVFRRKVSWRHRPNNLGPILQNFLQP
jgi:hypothetical protein